MISGISGRGHEMAYLHTVLAGYNRTLEQTAGRESEVVCTAIEHSRPVGPCTLAIRQPLQAAGICKIGVKPGGPEAHATMVRAWLY